MSRGMIPPEFTCATCEGTFDREDCADKDVTAPGLYRALREAAGGHVCFKCQDDFALCESCDTWSYGGGGFDLRGECEDCAQARKDAEAEEDMRGTWWNL